MPTATPTMPPSAIGVSKQRGQAVFLLQAFGGAEHAAEIADVLAEDRARRDRAPASRPCAEFSAWIMFIVGHGQTPSFLALAAQMPAASPCRRPRTSSSRSAPCPGPACRWLSASLLGRADLLRPLPSPAPRAAPRDHSPSAIRCVFSRSIGSPSGHALGFVGGAVAAGIVAGGMAVGAIGEKLDQRGAEIGARPLRRPLRRRIHGQEVVAVDAQAGRP